jgi:hypothetical protein
MAELATKTDLLATKQELQNNIETLGLRLNLQLGAMLLVGLAIMAIMLKRA